VAAARASGLRPVVVVVGCQAAEVAAAAGVGIEVLIGRTLFSEAMRMTGDQGARTLLAAYPVVEVPCDGTGEATDVDTPADLKALEET
jgi:CTP:molybdopterin cytidylyltransferase MocA